MAVDLVPAAQMTYQVNDKLWFGLTIKSPFGLVIYPYSYKSYFGLWTQVLDIDATPTISYKVNEWLSVGAGVQANYFKAELSNNLTPLVPCPRPGPTPDWGQDVEPIHSLRE